MLKVGGSTACNVLLQSTVDLNNEDDLYKLEIQCRGARLAVQATNQSVNQSINHTMYNSYKQSFYKLDGQSVN